MAPYYGLLNSGETPPVASATGMMQEDMWAKCKITLASPEPPLHRLSCNCVTCRITDFSTNFQICLACVTVVRIDAIVWSSFYNSVGRATLPTEYNHQSNDWKYTFHIKLVSRAGKPIGTPMPAHKSYITRTQTS